jgi:hypothetical protein
MERSKSTEIALELLRKMLAKWKIDAVIAASCSK